MAALSTGTGKATWGTAGCLWEEITETSQIRTSVFTPAAKCKMILSCQHLSPGLKDLKSYLCLSVIRSAVWGPGSSKGLGAKAQNRMCLQQTPLCVQELGMEADPHLLPLLAPNLSFLMDKAETSFKNNMGDNVL